MDDFVAYRSCWRIVAFGLACVFLFFLGLSMTGALGPLPETDRSIQLLKLIGWVLSAASVFAGALVLKQFFASREQLRIGPEGIRSVAWSDKTIPWIEILDVREYATRGDQKLIALRLRDPDQFPGPLPARLTSWANRMTTGGHVYISTMLVDRSLDEAMAAIDRFRVSPN